MTKNEEIVYANVCKVFDDCVCQMRKNIERAFEQHAVNCENRNPMFIGIANDVVAASMRCAIMNISSFVGSKDDAIKLSEQMFRNFVSEEKENEFLAEVFMNNENNQ